MSRDLSPQQEKIAKLLAQGKTVDEITSEIGVSKHTIQKQMSASYQKLGLNDKGNPKTRLAIWAWKRFFGE